MCSASSTITVSMTGLFLLLTAVSNSVTGAGTTLENQDSNWTQSVNPLYHNSSINSTSERYRRLIPYMTFYLTQGFLPQSQQYSPVPAVGNNLDGNLRYQQQNTANVPNAPNQQYPLLRNAYIVRTSVPPQQNYQQIITNQQQNLPSPAPIASPAQLQVQPHHPQLHLQPQTHQKTQPLLAIQPQAIGLSRYASYLQPLQSVRPLPITKPSYFTAPKQQLSPLEYNFQPIANKQQIITQHNQQYKEQDDITEVQQRPEDPIAEIKGPSFIQSQNQHNYPKITIPNFTPIKSTQYNQPSAEEDQRQQYAKLLYQNYNNQKQLNYPLKGTQEPEENTYSQPKIQNYPVLAQQYYQSTNPLKEDNPQTTIISESNYENQQSQVNSNNNQPDDDGMTIIQSQEIQVPQEETDPVQSVPETEHLEDLLAGYQLSKSLPERITSANIGSSIRTLSQILRLLQKANSLSGLNKSLLEETHHPDFSSNSKGHKFLQGFSPTRTEGSTPGKAGIDYPNYYEIPPTSFNCKDQRYKGFFGDPDTNCQVWHYCDLNGGQASFLCPNGTIFSQVALTCDWWFNVKCSSTAQLYVLNERLYKYILPVKPSFPEDYAGPLVDQYLALKYYEIENKRKNATKAATKTTTTTTTEATNSDYNPLQSLLTNEVKRKV